MRNAGDITTFNRCTLTRIPIQCPFSIVDIALESGIYSMQIVRSFRIPFRSSLMRRLRPTKEQHFS